MAKIGSKGQNAMPELVKNKEKTVKEEKVAKV